MRTVLIAGAAGFVGSHVADEARRHGVGLVLMSHRRALPVPGPAAAAPEAGGGKPPGADPGTGPRHRVIAADLTDPASLRGACAGVDVLLHCASHIGSSPERNESVNARGTKALVEEARRAGVGRIVYVSTASVYGRGTFRDAGPGRLTRRPASPTSRTRAAAEDTVLEAGGTVLRPHLVHGAGDIWVVPGLTRLLRALPGINPAWTSRTSLISVRDLARLVVGTGLAPAAGLTSSVHHATHPEPVTAHTLLRTVASCAGLRRPDLELPLDRARSLVAADGPASAALDMLRTDHWFDGRPLWRDLRLDPGPGFAADFAASSAWYRRTLPVPG
ncbi:NAD-dependent epimerase/dehydratase family protein [Streptomyces sp. NBC_01497]|uniref:NAD-dependent epimerase/dehydratase family protein n=1 Tax=Streptomyces sp. NBC_01497 TaxID=2903885 RepID=UPI002E3550CD|nr:NAD-dependent epimerase/dehydratase family protein [Streptomyces sp. NBC_01497]